MKRKHGAKHTFKGGCPTCKDGQLPSDTPFDSMPRYKKDNRVANLSSGRTTTLIDPDTGKELDVYQSPRLKKLRKSSNIKDSKEVERIARLVAKNRRKKDES